MENETTWKKESEGKNQHAHRDSECVYFAYKSYSLSLTVRNRFPYCLLNIKQYLLLAVELNRIPLNSFEHTCLYTITDAAVNRYKNNNNNKTRYWCEWRQ